MDRTEKQRSFVYLRQMEGGRESGYARAEQQERMVRLHIAVQGFAAEQEPYAFAVMEDGVLLLGKLRLDGRGQGGVSAQVSRQEYRDMQVLFVLCEGKREARIPLAGTPGRTGRVDWAVVKQLALQALHPVQTSAEEEKETQEKPAAEQVKPLAETVVTEEPAVQEPADAADDSIYDLAAQEEPYREAERELRTPIVPEKRVEMPDVLRNAYWPQKLWPMHDLFERFEEVVPFEGEEGSAYIRIPLDGKYGTVEYYLVGAKVKDGWVTSVGYLIPGTEEKRTGAAGSVYLNGYWQSWQEAEE